MGGHVVDVYPICCRIIIIWDVAINIGEFQEAIPSWTPYKYN